LQKRLAGDDAKVQDIEDKVNKMEDAGVLPRDGFAGTLNDRCGEVRKEQQNVSVSLAEAKPKYEISIFFVSIIRRPTVLPRGLLKIISY
jgi:hypothetical protein